MKKWLAGFMVCVFLLVWAGSALVQAAPSKPILYFWGNGCPHCRESAPIMDRIITKGVPVEKYEIYENQQNSDTLVMLFKTKGIPEPDWGVPVAFYNGQVYMGVLRIQDLEKDLADI